MLYNNANELIQIADPTGKILTVNKKWLKTLEYSKEEVINLQVFDIIRKDKLQQIGELMQKIKGGKGINFETIFISKSGKEIIVEGNGNGIFKDGKFISMIGIFRDISERRQAEEELKINRERLKTATSILRHDITNDLTVIKSAVDIYREEQDETMLDEIETRVWKSIETINNQRDQVRFLESHAELDVYNLEEVLQKVIKNYPDLKINITGTGTVYADNALYSVFDNIISNAVRHGKTTQLDIDIIPGKEHCEIRFKDYGTGVPDEIKDKIFDEGFHYGETGHTGIGLYIVQQTLDEYGGEVTVEDNKPHGAIFIIRMKKTIEG